MREKILVSLKRILISSVITIILLEIGLRLFGFGSFELPEFSMISSPAMHIKPDMKLGVHLVPGTYQVTINENLKYTATHLQKGYRTCGASSSSAPLIAFYGCSFTYGTGVNDNEVYPHLIQQQFDSLKIENRAVPGYGQAQVVVKLENDFKKDEKPAIVVLNYLSFHNERNTMNSAYQQKIRVGYGITKRNNVAIARFMCSYPYGRMVENELQMKKISIREINSTLPLINYSAISNSLQNLIEQKSVDEESDQKVTLAMISEINEICKMHEVKLIISYMTNDVATSALLKHCEKESIPTVDLYVDLTQKGFTNAPYDQHPSAKAHALFSEKIVAFLNKETQLQNNLLSE